jgi:hypothetical protein
MELALVRTLIRFTQNEAAAATKLIDPSLSVSGGALKNLERRSTQPTAPLSHGGPP